MRSLRYYLWIVPHLLCGATLLVALRNKVHKRLPAFVTLLAFDFVFELLVLLAVSWFFPLSTYQWWLVLDVAATFLLELLVLFELVREVVSPSPSLTRIFKPLPRWTAAVLVLVAATLAALLPQTALGLVMNVFVTMDFGLNLIVIGLLLAMLAFTRILGISWRGIPAGIVLGFGVVAATEMAAPPLMAQLGNGAYINVDILRMIGFHVCALIWLVYLLLPQIAARPSETAVQISDLEAHLQELQRIVRR